MDNNFLLENRHEIVDAANVLSWYNLIIKKIIKKNKQLCLRVKL